MPVVGLHGDSQLNSVGSEGDSIEELRIRIVKTECEMGEMRYLIRMDRLDCKA